MRTFPVRAWLKLLPAFAATIGCSAGGGNASEPPPGSIDDPRAISLVAAASAHREAGQFVEAWRALEEASELEPHAADLQVAWGDLYFALDRLPEADSLYRIALKKAPNHYWAHLRLGNVRFRQADFAAAARHFRDQLPQNPHPDVWHNLGSAYVMLGREDSAKAAFEQALTADPEHGPSLLRMAQLLEKQGDVENALGFAVRAHELLPQDLDIRKRVGLLHQQLGQDPQAIEALQPVVQMRPWDYQAHYALGRAYQASGAREAATRLLARSDTLRALERSVLLAERRAAQVPDDVRAQVEVARAYESVERDDAALRAYEKARLLAPRLAAIPGRMARLLHEGGRLDDAVVLYDEALQLDSSSFALWINAALAFADAGRWQHAEEALAEAERIEPHAAEVARIKQALAAGRRPGPP